MSDLNVVAVLKANSGSEAALQDALSALVPPSRAEEGCVGYELFRSAADASTFVTIETWRSQADLEAHMQTPHIAAALQALGGALDGAPAIHPLVRVDV